MWQILSLVVTIASPISLVQRLIRRARGLEVPEASVWTTPHPSVERPYPLLDMQLQKDMWADRRKDLDYDYWAAERATLDLPSIKYAPYPLPGRKEYILSQLDGRQSNDVRRDPL